MLKIVLYGAECRSREIGSRFRGQRRIFPKLLL